MHARVPVILVSALDSENDIVTGLDAGAHDFITKPISEPLVSARVRSAIRVKEAYDQQKRLTSELERSNAELDQFVHIASHDLQEPLRSVSMSVQLLKRQYQSELDEKAQEYIDFASDGVKRMSQLLKDLLEYSKVGSEELKLTPVDLNEIFESTATNLKAAVQSSGAEIEIQDLPHINGNAAQLSRLFQNLLSNGLKYCESGTTPKLQIHAEQHDAVWRIFVKDNGIGIPENSCTQVFGVFKRLHTRKEYPGTGIGLAIAKKIVEVHGGRLWVEESSDAGTTFCTEFPVLVETTQD
jgi:light-regulated signal transduction histidine kinase (bacteriophytochrome)